MKFWRFILLGVLIGGLALAVFEAHHKSGRSTPSLAPVSPAAATVTSTATSTASTTITMTGMYVGLLDATDRYQRTYMYLLLQTSSGIERVDLRPIYGMNYTNIKGRLGVHQGELVTATGLFHNGTFDVRHITAATTTAMSRTAN